MKFKDIINWASENEYRSSEGFSYSILKSIADDGPIALTEAKKQLKSEALDFGSLVDIIISEPENRYNIFYTKAIEKPTASLLNLADELLRDHSILEYKYEDLTDKKYIEDKIKTLGLWGNLKEETLQKKYDLPIFYEYLKASIEAEGKIICTPTLIEAAEHCAKVLLNHEYTRHLFEESDGVEVLKQVPISYIFKGILGKGKIDLLRIDHNKKLISVYDIKTGSELPSNFENSFYFFKYYLQVVSYLLAVSYLIFKNEEFKDYTIDKFRFIYISKKLSDVPCIYEVDEKLVNEFFKGWINGKGEYIKGFEQLVDEYAFYTQRDMYNIEKKVFDNNGILNITLS